MADNTQVNTQYSEILRRLRWPIFLTRTGLLAERLARSFWPLWSICLATLALLMLGVQDSTSVELVWTLGAAVLLGVVVFFVRGALRFRYPRRAEALARLDASLKGAPLQSLRDAQAGGAADPGTLAIWQAHQSRMAARAATARAVQPDLTLNVRDPFGLRYVALLVLMVGLLFGSVLRIGSITEMTPGGAATAAAGPSWEGWMTPPPHTGLPTVYLPDITDETLRAPQGAQVALRLYGPVGRLGVTESVSGRVGELPDPSTPAQEFIMAREGEIAIDGPGGRTWQVALIPDQRPAAEIMGPGEANVDGRISIPFRAEDDYGVTGGTAFIRLDLAAVERRYGLAIDPEPRDPIEMQMPLPIAGDRSDFEEMLIENFSEHPWANMPVEVVLMVEDATGQTGDSAPFAMELDARRFFDPVAAALIEMRRDLLWNRENAARVARVLRSVAWAPDGASPVLRSETDAMRLRNLIRRMETTVRYVPLTDEQVEEHAKTLWDLALEVEDVDLDDARERMQRAQERLEEAMRNGASEEEIARLMQELRDATEDFMRQMAQEAARDAEQNPGQQQQPFDMQNTMQMNQDDLQRMMDRIQELMEQGRMAEAQEALRELQQMMENMRMTQGQQGQGQQGEGQQAMEGLSETLRNQQDLSDEAFRDLQRQFNQDQGGQQQGQQGQQQGQQGGQQGQQGQQQGQGQQGQGQQGGQQGNPQMGEGQQPGGNGDGPDAGSLAERQEALRRELERQRGNLPGADTEAGRTARESLDQADRAMRGAEEALRQNDLAGAIDRQAQALDALREGMRQLGEAMSEQQRQFAGQQGEGEAQDGGAQQNDPLGRRAGSEGGEQSQQDMLQGEDVYRRAQDLLDELRRRSGETARSQTERDYLGRLLDRF